MRLLTLIDSYGIPTRGRSQIWVDASTGDYALEDRHLGTILQPLRAYRENMLVISNLSLDSMRATGDAAAHGALTCQTLTGSRASNASSRARPGPNATQAHASLDVRVGEYLNRDYGLSSPRVYSHLLLSDYAENQKATFSFGADGRQIRARSTVPNIVGALFAGVEGSDVFEQIDAQSQLAVLGLVGDRVRAVRGELSQANASAVMDAYRASVEDLSAELEIRGNQVCEPPNFASIPSNGKDPETTPLIFESIYHAFACDLASSITYAIGGEQINQLNHGYLYDSAFGDSELQRLLRQNFHSPSHRTDEVSDKSHELVRIHQATLLAGLLDRMSSTTDVDGVSSLLDNTVIYVTSAMAKNVHSVDDYAYLLIAGRNTGLQGGRHYDVSQSTNNDLLTTIAQGLSLPDVQFGGHRMGNGPVAALNNGPIEKMLRGAP
ncbi:MAG: DUF1552 domain-containing protein [Myxococcota bacterium]